MPCISDWQDEGYSMSARSEIDLLTRMLCEACRLLDERPKPIPESMIISDDLRCWWKGHKALDEQRRKREEDLAKIEAKRKQALSKLTAAERKLLGLAP